MEKRRTKNENDNACNKRRNEPDYDKQGKKKKTVHQKNEIHEKNQKNLLQSLHHAKHDWTWLLNGGIIAFRTGTVGPIRDGELAFTAVMLMGLGICTFFVKEYEF